MVNQWYSITPLAMKPNSLFSLFPPLHLTYQHDYLLILFVFYYLLSCINRLCTEWTDVMDSFTF